MNESYEEAVHAAGVVELPDEYVARATAPSPQPPLRWEDLMSGRWEDGNPPGVDQ